MQKGEFLITKDGKRVYQMVGYWSGDVVLAPVSEDTNQVLIYTASELEELISEGCFKRHR